MFKKMFLVSKMDFEKIKKGGQSCDQINNTDVHSGGRVNIYHSKECALPDQSKSEFLSASNGLGKIKSGDGSVDRQDERDNQYSVFYPAPSLFTPQQGLQHGHSANGGSSGGGRSHKVFPQDIR